MKAVDSAIQGFILPPLASRAYLSVAAVQSLILEFCSVSVSLETSRKAMMKLGYDYCKLQDRVRLTSKRVKRIEDFVVEYDEALALERTGEYIVVRTDESYICAGAKKSTGWCVKGGLPAGQPGRQG